MWGRDLIAWIARGNACAGGWRSGRRTTGTHKGVPLRSVGDFRRSSDGNADTEPDTDPDTDTDTDPDTEPDTEPDTDPDTEPDTEPDTDPDTDPDTEPDTAPAPDPAAISPPLPDGKFAANQSGNSGCGRSSRASSARAPQMRNTMIQALGIHTRYSGMSCAKPRR